MDGHSQQLAIMMKEVFFPTQHTLWLLQEKMAVNVTGLAHAEQHKEHLMISLDSKTGKCGGFLMSYCGLLIIALGL